jgi:hypothetical protein
MRTLALSILVIAACGGDDSNHKQIDASIKIIDAPKPIDAAVDAVPDAPPDATPMNVVTACMHACDAIGVCVMEPFGQECYDECAADLADCTAAQVMAIDACSTEMCGDIENKMSPLLTCIQNVACVEMAVAFRRK